MGYTLGMTNKEFKIVEVRDGFARAMMEYMISHNPDAYSPDVIAMISYRFADAMMRARRIAPRK